MERDLFKSSKESGDIRIDDNISKFSDESLSSVNILTDSDLKILEERFNSEINNMHKKVTKSHKQMFSKRLGNHIREQDQTTVKGIREQIN